jgi:hypothetical protein
LGISDERESILNMNKTAQHTELCITLGGFWQIDAPSRICSEPPSPFPDVDKSPTRRRKQTMVEFKP